MKRTFSILTAVSGLVLGMTSCKSHDVIIINTPPPVTGTPKTTTTTPKVTRPAGKTDPTAIEPVKSPSTYSNP